MSLPAGQAVDDDYDDDDEEWKTEYVHFREGLVLPNFKRVKGDHVHKKRRRRLSQTDPLPQLNVNFYNCVFQGNYGPRNFQYDSGLTLIYMPGPDVNLYMRRCSFDSNDFPQYAPPRPQAVSVSSTPNHYLYMQNHSQHPQTLSTTKTTTRTHRLPKLSLHRLGTTTGLLLRTAALPTTR